MKYRFEKWNQFFRRAEKVCLAVLPIGPMFFFLLVLGSHTAVFAGDAILSWNPNSEPDLAGYKVYAGTSSGVYGSPIDVGNQTTYTVTGLSSGTFYFAVTAYNTSNHESAPSIEVSKTFAGSDTTPPAISSIASNSITSSSASITWTTNEASDSQIQYGTTTGYGSSTSLNLSLVTTHVQNLTGLLSSTTYHYRVISKDAVGNLATSGDNTFTTIAPPDTTAPVISGITSSNITGTGAIITWSTNEPATSQVEYGTTTAFGSLSALNSTPVTSHSKSLIGLSPSTQYHYRVISRDVAGNTRLSATNTFITTTAPDVAPPIISNIAVTQVGDQSAVITWSTNEAATSEVSYGMRVPYDFTSISSSPLVTTHSRSLNGLDPSTTYHFKILSRDAAGNSISSADQSFMTSAPSDTAGPVISNIVAGNVVGNSIDVTWVTDESATTEVEYGPTSAYGNFTPLNATLSTNHTQTISGLLDNVLYHYRVRSIDAAGNLAVSGDHFFTMQINPDATAPTDVEQFKANAQNRTVQLSWTNPSDSDFAGVVVRYRIDGTYPSTETDGLPVGDFKGLPNEKIQTDHTSLQNNVTYYYAAFTYDIHGNYSRTAKTFATPGGSETTASSSAAGGGGCGMILPTRGSSGPSQAADMMTLIAIIIIATLKKLAKKVTTESPVSQGWEAHPRTIDHFGPEL